MASHYRDHGPLDCKVYVGDLGNGAAKHEIERAFSSYGPLNNVWVARHPAGFAFVEFQDSRDAYDAVRGMDGKHLCNRRVRVEMCSGKTRRSRRRDDRFSRDRYGGGSRYGGSRYRSRSRSPRRYRRSRSRSPRRYRSRSRSPRRYSPKKRDYSRSRSRSRSRSHSKDRARSRSPSPVANRSRSPVANHSHSPATKHSRSRSRTPAENDKNGREEENTENTSPPRD